MLKVGLIFGWVIAGLFVACAFVIAVVFTVDLGEKGFGIIGVAGLGFVVGAILGGAFELVGHSLEQMTDTE
jgi:hypothetical protein